MTTPCRRAEVIKEDRADPKIKEWVRIRIVNMTARHARLWDLTFAPRILVGSESRADRFWSWSVLRVMGPQWQQLKGYRCRALSVLMDVTKPGTNKSVELPVGMMLFIEQYPHAVKGDGDRATFAWLVAAAPKDAMKDLGFNKRPSLGRILVDTAMGHSEAHGLDGRMWLHCAPAGGDRLLGFYANSCKLLNLPKTELLPVTRRRNDGRYFYSTESLAQTLLQELSGLRI
jgi:hypothetical protein